MFCIVTPMKENLKHHQESRQKMVLSELYTPMVVRIFTYNHAK